MLQHVLHFARLLYICKKKLLFCLSDSLKSATCQWYTPIRFKQLYLKTLQNFVKLIYRINENVQFHNVLWTSGQDGLEEVKRKHLHDQPSAPEAAMSNHILFLTSPKVWKRAATISMINWISTAACMKTIQPKIERGKYKSWISHIQYSNIDQCWYMFPTQKLLSPHKMCLFKHGRF